MKGKFDPYVLRPLDLDLGPLNSRPVYCSRLYGIHFLIHLFWNMFKWRIRESTKVAMTWLNMDHFEPKRWTCKMCKSVQLKLGHTNMQVGRCWHRNRFFINVPYIISCAFPEIEWLMLHTTYQQVLSSKYNEFLFMNFYF